MRRQFNSKRTLFFSGLWLILFCGAGCTVEEPRLKIAQPSPNKNATAIAVRGSPDPAPGETDVTLPSIKPITAAEFIKEWDGPPRDFYQRSIIGPIEGEELTKIKAFLLEQFPFVSLRSRLGHESDAARLNRHSGLHANLPDDVALLKSAGPNYFSIRGDALRKLHSDEADLFINAPGFGLFRMRPPNPYDLKPPYRGDVALNSEYQSAVELAYEQPVELESVTGVTGGSSQTEAAELHQTSQMMFFNPDNNGLVRNVDEVAGFEAHGLDGIPSVGNLGGKPGNADENTVWWKLNRLELVSLLKHDHFAVYTSESLPNMEQLDGVPTRTLDEFELLSLGRLFGGEDLVVNATTNRIRMLGGLRASEQCLECHSVKKGELLGAFSYELLRKPKLSIN
jgi:hypothetical protein